MFKATMCVFGLGKGKKKVIKERHFLKNIRSDKHQSTV